MASNSDRFIPGAKPQLIALGVNHLTASVSLRDQLLLDEESLQKFTTTILSEGLVRETVVLSTCNRSEIYGMTLNPTQTHRDIEKIWGSQRGVSEDEIRNHGYFFTQGEAMRHLFRVIGSLDSLVLGEMQIFGQVKYAYQLATEKQWADFYLNHIFQSGIHAGKRIHTETGIHEGAVSISYAAVELARKVLGELDGSSVAVVGAGEMGELAAQHFHKAGARNFRFFNRTRGSAERLAASFGGDVFLLSDIPEGLAHCDIVVAATGAPGIVITREHVLGASRHRQGKPLFLIDIAAPRDIDSEVASIENTYLFTIDDLKSVVQENVELRRHSSQKAQAIVEEECCKVEAWFQSLDIVPLLKNIREKYQVITDKEIEKWAAGQPPQLRQQLESLGRGLLNKFLHDPSIRLKTLGEQGDAARAGYYASKLFALSEEEKRDDHE